MIQEGKSISLNLGLTNLVRLIGQWDQRPACLPLTQRWGYRYAGILTFSMGAGDRGLMLVLLTLSLWNQLFSLYMPFGDNISITVEMTKWMWTRETPRNDKSRKERAQGMLNNAHKSGSQMQPSSSRYSVKDTVASPERRMSVGKNSHVN